MTEYTEKTMLDEVLEIEKEDYFKRQVVYEFDGGKRKFVDTDNTDKGVYDGT